MVRKLQNTKQDMKTALALVKDASKSIVKANKTVSKATAKQIIEKKWSQAQLNIGDFFSCH